MNNVNRCNPIPTTAAPLVSQPEHVETENCAICLEDPGNSGIVATFPCTHIYHNWCIDQWLTDPKHADFGCPLCKRKIAHCLYPEKTPLHVAAARGQSDIVDGLLEQGANASAITTKDGITALHCAASKGDVATINCLIKHGADVNALTPPTRHGDTPLHLAMLNSHEAAIIALIDSGAGINHLVPDERSPLHFAAAKGFLNAIKILLDKGADITAGSRTPLHFAVEHGQHDAIRLLLDRGANIDAQAPWLPKVFRVETAIHHFFNIGRIRERTDKSTVRYGEREFHRKQYKKTPLHIAIETGQVKIVDLLLTAGAATNVLIGRGETLWSWINRVNKLTTPIIKSLARGLCRSEAPCDDMRAGLLSELIKINDWDLFDQLLARTPGADINTLRYPGSCKSAFHEVIMEGQKDKIQAMITRSADVNTLYHSGWTTLHCAVFSHHAHDAIEVLIACKVDVNAKNSKGQTPLHLAAKFGKSKVIDQLIGHGAFVNATTSRVDVTPDALAKDVGMMTPLHYAAIEGYSNAVQRLIDQGASTKVRAQNGKTAFELSDTVLTRAQNSVGVDHFFSTLTFSNTLYMAKKAEITTYTDIVNLLKVQPSVNLSENL